MVLSLIAGTTFTHEKTNKFVVDDIQAYTIPTSQDISTLEEVDSSNLMMWRIHKLVSPRKLDGIVLDFSFTNNMSRLMPFRQNLRKRCYFTLPFGQYKVSNQDYEVTLEEMVSDNNRPRKVSDAELLVPPGYWLPRKERPIRIFCYPKGTLVTISGRVVDSSGTGIKGVCVKGCPDVNDPYDIAWYPTIETSTDETGTFRFKNIPPASLDLLVRFLLFGHLMKPSYDSERLFYFDYHIDRLPPQYTRERRHFVVPLISERNLKAILPFANKIRALNSRMKKHMFELASEKEIRTKIPISTNDVIYVEDILLLRKD